MINIKNPKFKSEILVLSAALIVSLLIISDVNAVNSKSMQTSESNLKPASYRANFELEYFMVAGSFSDDDLVGMKLDQTENVILYGDIGVNTDSDIAFIKHNPLSLDLQVILDSTNSTVWGGDNNDFVSKLEIDSLGNTYIAGSTESFGSGGLDLCLVKYNETMEYQWNKTWGYTSNEACWDMLVDSNDNIFLLGVGSISFGLAEIYLVKYDSNGNQLWNKTCCNDFPDAYSVIGKWDILSKDTNNNIYFGYFSDVEYSARLLKYSNLGELLFNISHTFPDPGWFWELKVITDEFNNIYFLGDLFYSDFTKRSDFCLLKYNDLGILQWNKTWDFYNGEDSPMDMAFDLEGNLYIIGTSWSGYSIVVKINKNGNLLWKTNTDTILPIEGEAYALAFDSKNNLYISGATDDTEGGDFDMLLVSYDPNGELLGKYSWGPNKTERAYEICINSNDEIFVAGTTNSFTNSKDFFLVKVKVEFKTIGFDFIPLIIGLSVTAVAVIGVSIVVKVRLKKRKT